MPREHLRTRACSHRAGLSGAAARASARRELWEAEHGQRQQPAAAPAEAVARRRRGQHGEGCAVRRHERGRPSHAPRRGPAGLDDPAAAGRARGTPLPGRWPAWRLPLAEAAAVHLNGAGQAMAWGGGGKQAHQASALRWPPPPLPHRTLAKGPPGAPCPSLAHCSTWVVGKSSRRCAMAGPAGRRHTGATQVARALPGGAANRVPDLARRRPVGSGDAASRQTARKQEGRRRGGAGNKLAAAHHERT